MSTPCPKGHPSTDPDYCSECGMRMDAAAAPNPAPPPANSGISASGGDICPDCATPRVGGSRFCEVCRYDFSPQAGGAPAAAAPPVAVSSRTPAPMAAPLPLPAVPALSPAPVSNRVAAAPALAPSLEVLPERLNVVVITDPALVTEPDPAKPCPVGAPDRVFPLDLAENLVGRRSDTKGIYPEVEVSDPGVSHRHIKFIRQDDGSFAALDLGSANGTEFNGTSLTPGVAVRVKAGDELLVGLWTRLKLQSRT